MSRYSNSLALTNASVLYRSASCLFPPNKGQYVCIDPISKLVMVQTAVEAPGDNDETWSLWSINSAKTNLISDQTAVSDVLAREGKWGHRDPGGFTPCPVKTMVP